MGLKHFGISVPRNIRVAEVRKRINRTITFNKGICNLTPEYRDILKKGAISPLFHNILLPVLRFTGARISLRDKRGRDNESRLYKLIWYCLSFSHVIQVILRRWRADNERRCAIKRWKSWAELCLQWIMTWALVIRCYKCWQVSSGDAWDF